MGIELIGIIFYGYSFQKMISFVQTASAYSIHKFNRDDAFDTWVLNREKVTPNAHKASIMDKIIQAT